ncbi:MAG: cupin domain-containing protein [Candidatus Hodarchaeota archaeon]
MSEIRKTKITKNELQKKGIDISRWSNWDCEPSEFDWEYAATETAYVFEGDAEIETEDGKKVVIKGGDLVQFPEGLKTKWKVNQTIRKVFTFDKVDF